LPRDPFELGLTLLGAFESLEEAQAFWSRLVEELPEHVVCEGGEVRAMHRSEVIPGSPLAQRLH
jgi:hypothetical protein